MTLSIFQNGTQENVTSPGEWDLATVTGPATYAALIDVQNQDGVELRLSWVDDFVGGLEVWAEHRIVDVDALDASVGMLTPPVPIGMSGKLHLEVIAGTLGASFIDWIVYKL